MILCSNEKKVESSRLSTGDILYNLRGDSVFTDVAAAGLVPFLYVPGVLSAHLFRGAERWLGRWRCYERSGMTYRSSYHCNFVTI